MRWGSTGNNVGVGATLNANTSFYYYHEPVGPLGLSHSQPRGIVQAKNPPDKRLGRSTGRSLNILKKAPNLEVEPESTGHSPLIMCAGRRVYSDYSEDRDNNHRENSSRTSSIGGDTKPPPNNQPEPFTVMANTYSPLRHHTDEELEQIIRDLRDQVFQKQGQQPTNNESETTQAQKHSRKHLKNPVEKMETAKMPVSASVGSTSHELLHRPLSSSQLNRLVAETTIQMVVPAVLTASPSTARIAGRTTSSPQVSSLDLSSLRRSRPNSSSVNPRSKSATTTRLRQKKKVEQDDSSDCDEGYLYLVDESEGESEALSLSPVGPWVVDSFTIETPRSPSASTCYSVSSFGSEGLDVGEVCTTTDVAAMSPRSRLLYFSACADDSETSRTHSHGAVLRRCGSALTSRALEARNVKPKRCSSATISTRVRTTSASRLKTRRRKQSGSITSSRSSNSDTLATQR